MRNIEQKILVIGSGGLIGGTLVKRLNIAGFKNVVPCAHKDLELTDQRAVDEFITRVKPDVVVFGAVKAITDFEAQKVSDFDELIDNLFMCGNVISSCKKNNVQKAIFLGSAMLYPWNLGNEKPFLEDDIEQFNWQGYRKSMKAAVLSKFVNYQLCEAVNKDSNYKYVFALITHVYGGYEGRRNLYLLEKIVQEICDAKQFGKTEISLDIWGEGLAKKQFLHVDDCADALIAIIDNFDKVAGLINITTDKPECWKRVAEITSNTVGYTGSILFNTEHKEDMTNRLCSPEKINAIGWKPKISIEDGIASLCEEYNRIKGYN